MSTLATPEQLVADFFDAFGRRDVDALMTMVADDITEDLAGVGVISGAEADRAFLTDLFGSFPDLETKVTRVVGAGNVVVVEYERQGTFTGTPWQGLPANDNPFAFRGCALVEVHGGRVTRVNGYADMTQFARDLGVLPAEGSASERIGVALFRTRVFVRRAIRALTPSFGRP